MAIIYTQSPVNPKAYRTQKYGNLLTDTIQGEVDNYCGTWSGWRTNLSNPDRTEFRNGFRSKAAATRWVNKWLRQRGIK